MVDEYQFTYFVYMFWRVSSDSSMVDEYFVGQVSEHGHLRVQIPLWSMNTLLIAEPRES